MAHPHTKAQKRKHTYPGSLCYGLNGRVEFIEAAESPEFVITFQGVNLHATAAKDVIDLFSAHAPYDQNDPEFGYSYIFKPLEVALWRSVMPEADDDTEGRYFEAVGTGAPGYFSEQ